MLNFDTVNSQLAGSPLWESIKSQTLATLAGALGIATAQPVAVIAPTPAPVVAPVKRGRGRPVDPTSKRRRALAIYLGGGSNSDVAKALNVTTNYATSVRWQLVKRGLLPKAVAA